MRHLLLYVVLGVIIVGVTTVYADNSIQLSGVRHLAGSDDVPLECDVTTSPPTCPTITGLILGAH